MITSYHEAQVFLESFIHPSIYKRIAKQQTVVNPLERMRYLLSLIGNPQDDFQSVIVTGTSGKGSTAFLLASILTEAGCTTGLTISPHVQKLTERMQINNKEIGEKAYLDLLNQLIPTIEQMKESALESPTYYEILLALAFLYFSELHVDIAICEVGLEGKYDGTNTLNSLMTILTNISLDHTELLGNTVEKIASEAVSAIHKDENILISGVTQASVWNIVEQQAKEMSVSDVHRRGTDFQIKNVRENEQQTIFSYMSKTQTVENIALHLVGAYQAENAGLAIAGSYALSRYGISVQEKHIRNAFAKAAQFPGRFEFLKYRGYDFLLDGAHNQAKMRAFTAALGRIEPHRQKIFILSFKKDKDISSMLPMIYPLADIAILTTLSATADMSKNAMISIGELRKKAENGKNIRIADDIGKAIEVALKNAQHMTDPLIVVTGSLYLVGKARTLLVEADVLPT